ncbi:MAG: cyclic nucleotide-binding domain-containing protein [Gammaproteobacteria bacterium]
MAEQRQLIDKAVLRLLIPASALNQESFHELSNKTYVEELAAGRPLFKVGDTDRKNTYVIEGEVQLTSDKGQVSSVVGGSTSARHPLGNHQPRQHNAIARTACRIVRIDSDLLDVMLTWDQLSGIEVTEIQPAEEEGEGGDWMTRILQSRAFQQVPAANIQAMFMQMQEVPFKAGDVVIKQGDDGDYYYVIKTGKAKVTRPSKAGTELVLAQLNDGDAFGEEALLSEAKRNATVVMTSDGVLMRLSKADFNSLLKEPMLTWVKRSDAEARIAKGAKWLDVRLESEAANDGMKGAINIPLFMLRLKMESLDPNVEYIVYCDTGRRSSAAAFLLSERGFKAAVLEGGLRGQAA